MKRIHLPLAAAMAVAFGAAPMPAAAFAGNDVAAATDPNFVPDTGAINRGFDEPVPSLAHGRAVPTPEETRAALKMPDSADPSPGAVGAGNTTGAGTPSAAPTGPIGSTGQTMPAKFSRRNDILDRTPIMALALSLSDAERSRIFQAVMADKTSPAATDERLAPASQLDAATALHDMHPLPASLGSIAAVQSLAYVKTKNKVFLVRPATRVVVDVIGS